MQSIKIFIARLLAFFLFFIRVLKIKFSRKKDRIIFLVNVPSHGNLGDQLIAEAEKQLFQTQFPNIKLIEITTGELWAGKVLMHICVRKDAIICLSGGGYLGTLWPEEENRVRFIINHFQKNTIIIFPQTVFYESIVGKYFEDGQKIYSSHNRLHVFTREQQSYDFVRKHLMPNAADRVYLLPDVALTYENRIEQDNKRYSILICMRNDKEKLQKNDELLSKVKSFLPEDSKISYTDTTKPYPVPLSRRIVEIEDKICEISSAKLFITDRLHGMIYAAISGTPTIVFDNFSKKVRNVYDLWLKGNRLVRYVDEYTDIQTTVSEMLSVPPQKHDFENYLQYFIVLNSIIDSK